MSDNPQKSVVGTEDTDQKSALPLLPLQIKFLPYVLAVALFVQILDGTILNTALLEMALALGESPLNM